MGVAIIPNYNTRFKMAYAGYHSTCHHGGMELGRGLLKKREGELEGTLGPFFFFPLYSQS